VLAGHERDRHAGSSVSSTRLIFSATDHRWQRCTEVITLTRCTSDTAVRLGSCLVPHAMALVRSKRGSLQFYANSDYRHAAHADVGVENGDEEETVMGIGGGPCTERWFTRPESSTWPEQAPVTGI
jgi:hypothetical protein